MKRGLDDRIAALPAGSAFIDGCLAEILWKQDGDPLPPVLTTLHTAVSKPMALLLRYACADAADTGSINR